MIDTLTGIVLNGSIQNHVAEIVAGVLTGILASNLPAIRARIQSFLGDERAKAAIDLGNEVRNAIADGKIEAAEVLSVVQKGKGFVAKF